MKKVVQKLAVVGALVMAAFTTDASAQSLHQARHKLSVLQNTLGQLSVYALRECACVLVARRLQRLRSESIGLQQALNSGDMYRASDEMDALRHAMLDTKRAVDRILFEYIKFEINSRFIPLANELGEAVKGYEWTPLYVDGEVSTNPPGFGN